MSRLWCKKLYLFFYKQVTFNEEVNCTEPSPSVRVPWWNILKIKASLHSLLLSFSWRDLSLNLSPSMPSINMDGWANIKPDRPTDWRTEKRHFDRWTVGHINRSYGQKVNRHSNRWYLIWRDGKTRRQMNIQTVMWKDSKQTGGRTDRRKHRWADCQKDEWSFRIKIFSTFSNILFRCFYRFHHRYNSNMKLLFQADYLNWIVS